MDKTPLLAPQMQVQPPPVHVADRHTSAAEILCMVILFVSTAAVMFCLPNASARPPKPAAYVGIGTDRTGLGCADFQTMVYGHGHVCKVLVSSDIPPDEATLFRAGAADAILNGRVNTTCYIDTCRTLLTGHAFAIAVEGAGVDADNTRAKTLLRCAHALDLARIDFRCSTP